MSKKNKQTLIRIIISGILFAILFILEHTGCFEALPNHWILLPIYMVPYLIIGYDILLKSIRNIRNGQVFDEHFLMMIATLSAFGIREFEEAVAVMLFYQVGELFQSIAVGKSRESIKAMMDICPEYANLERDGQIETVDPDDVEIGSIIVIKPGERIPLDGIVIDGESDIDTAALTGESMPRFIQAGEEIYSGCVNGQGVLRVQTTKEFDDSTVSRILELVENASSKKAKVENFITKFARYYTPVVTICALILAIVPAVLFKVPIFDCIERACIFLVVSCPCALVISVPMGFFGGIGAASTQGILVKGGNYLELASELKTVVFDKTGTLTEGKFKVSDVIEGCMNKVDIIRYAAAVESLSTHPIALSIKAECNRLANTDTDSVNGDTNNGNADNNGVNANLAIDSSLITDIEEISGHGICASIDGKKFYAGNKKLMDLKGIACDTVNAAGTLVYLGCEDSFAGAIVISDSIKDGAMEALKDMKAAGIEKTVMLTGDNESTASIVAKTLGIDEYHAGLLPAQKVEWVEKLLAEGKRLAFVGDGINDAPVLSRADLGIAMGSLGSDAAIEASDIVLMDDDIKKIAATVRISKKTLRIVRQNVVFALSVKILVLILAAFGLTNMWVAVFADVGVSVLAIMNSMRCLAIHK